MSQRVRDPPRRKEAGAVEGPKVYTSVLETGVLGMAFVEQFSVHMGSGAGLEDPLPHGMQHFSLEMKKGGTNPHRVHIPEGKGNR